MTYTKPSVERSQVVGQMITTISQCRMYGGKWDNGKCYEPQLP